MTAIILTKPYIVEGLVVVADIFLSPLRVFEYPFLESLLHQVLLFPCEHGLIFVDLIMIFAIPVINTVLDCYGS